MFLRKLKVVVEHWNISITLRQAALITKKMTLPHKKFYLQGNFLENCPSYIFNPFDILGFWLIPCRISD